MPIKYVIHRCSLPSSPDTHMARVQPTYVADLEDIVERIVGHGTTVARSDLYSALEDFFSAVEELLREGIFVDTPLACFRVSIKGPFADAIDDSFDPARHRVVPRIIPARRLREALRRHSEVVKQRRLDRRPVLDRFVDVASGTFNDVLTPGGAGRVVGDSLKYDPADPAQGVFFIAEDASEVRADVLVRNMPSEVILTNPALAAGRYRLQVRASFNGNGDIRSGTLERTLTVH